MGDAENGPSKKRAAGRELSRDNPGLDDEDTPEEETGTFKKASEEVLASRRIIKVRRQQSNSDPSPNPFAGICLVASNESNANSTESTVVVQSEGEMENVADGKGGEDAEKPEEEKHEPELKTDASKDKPDAEKDSSTGNQTNAGTGIAKNRESEDKLVDAEKEIGYNDPTLGKETADKVSADKETLDNVIGGEAIKSGAGDVNGTGNEDKKENEEQNKEQSSEGATFKSFQQLSSTQNAFTGLAGTGFSSSTFSFGSLSNDGSALGGASSSIFGLKDNPLGLGLSTNGNSSSFSSTVAATGSKGEGSGFPALQEVPVETGEENEKTVFTADSVLFEFVDKGWKERGKGELRVNVTTTGTEVARLLMRARGNYRLILNARLYADMKLTNMDKRGVTFACVNSATEVKDALSTFALKFKDGAVLEEFQVTVMEHKCKAATIL